MSDPQDVDALIDEAHALYAELNDMLALWSADLDQIERWVATSPAHSADVRMRGGAMVERVMSTADGDCTIEDRASLLTAAAALREIVATADIAAERTWSGPSMGLVPLLPSMVPVLALATAEHGDRYREKLRRFPAAVDELRARLETSVADGRVQTRRNAEATVALIDRMLAADATEDPLAGQAAPTQLDETAAATFRDELVELVRTHTRPALSRLRDTLRDVSIPAGTDDDHPGMVHLPDGEQEYGEILAAYTQPGTTPHEVHATGLAQLQRLEDEWASVGQETFGISDPAEVRRRVAEHPGRQTAEEVHRDATALIELATERAPSWFNRTPTARCEVKLVESGAIAFYRPPSEDGSLPGYCHINVADPTTWAATLAATVAHEGIPGHHYQIALAREDADLHPVHRDVLMSTFPEGWALYSERIADQVGLYPQPIDRLGMLTTDAWRAARMVVDTGLHAFGWTRDRAVTALQVQAGLKRADAEAEVDRFIAWPGQAVSYMNGRLAIEAARDRAQKKLGAQFDIVSFHDVVLSRGIVSLDALDEMVDHWAAGAG